MLQFQLTTERDRKEAAILERRRAIEEERKKRIFNPRLRLYGNDKEALAAQIEEKKKQAAEEKKMDEAFDAQLNKYCQIAQAIEQKENAERKKLAREINEFRTNFQKFEDRREFDLNNPKAPNIPARLHDNDPRVGISSMQKFEGEDMLGAERARIQEEQRKAWLNQQVEERRQADKDRKAAEEAYRAATIARDERALELDRMEKDCRKKLDEMVARFNRALADERLCIDKERQRQEREDNTAATYNIMMSDMMTENPDVSLSNMGPNRRIGYLYKGMTPAEKEVFKRAQLDQIEEHKKIKAEQRRFEQEWEMYSDGIRKHIAQLDKEMLRKEKERAKDLAEENKKMADEQKNHQQFLNKVVYRNKATAAYFDQFNTTTR